MPFSAAYKMFEKAGFLGGFFSLKKDSHDWRLLCLCITSIQMEKVSFLSHWITLHFFLGLILTEAIKLLNKSAWSHNCLNLNAVKAIFESELIPKPTSCFHYIAASLITSTYPYCVKERIQLKEKKPV